MKESTIEKWSFFLISLPTKSDRFDYVTSLMSDESYKRTDYP